MTLACPARRSRKIGVVGAGGAVGSAAALAIAMSVSVEELLLVDVDRDALGVHAMDLEPVTALGFVDSIRAVRLQELVDADVVVVTASAPHVDGTSRVGYLSRNAPIVRSIAAELIGAAAWSGRLVVVTTPVDVICTLVAADSGERARDAVVGYSLNDTMRLRQALGRREGVAASRVDAWAIGEHGDHCVPLLSRATIDGRALRLDENERRLIGAELAGWYERWQRLRPGRTTALASAAGIAHVVGALVSEQSVTSVACVPVDDRYGITGACIGVPVHLSWRGAGIVDWQLAAEELKAVAAAGSAVRRLARNLRSLGERT